MPDLSVEASFYLIWASLLLAPPVAVGTFFAVRRWWPGGQYPLVLGSASILILALGSALLKLSFTGTFANFVFVSVAYAAYCFLAASCWRIQPKFLRIISLIATAAPIFLGYLLGTIGWVGLELVVMDYAALPWHVEQMNAALVCRVTGWGSSFTDSGYVVHLYKVWTSVPFLQKHVAQIIVNETGPGLGPVEATCADVLATYNQIFTRT
jgi:hypothetical protein